jgi:aminoglycoside phosphotransferase (APT) family kinase protein
MSTPNHTPALDAAGAVRSGEELPLAAVHAFLQQHIPSLQGQTEPEVQQFAGGASNLTYLLRYPVQDLILRRPPFGHRAKSAHDMLREARIMRALAPVYAGVPEVLAVCDDPSIMEADFYVMARIHGLIPRQNLPEGLNLSPAQTRQLCLNVIDKLIELHQVDHRAAGLEGLAKGEGYVQRQIEGWSERYQKARTDDVPDGEAVMAWLRDKMPAQDSATCLIHNDFRFDNVVLSPDNPLRVVGVLDWEMATLGDPLMDLANSLAYWVQADDDATFLAMRRQPTHLSGMLTRQEVIEYYGQRTGRSVQGFDFYMVYGLFRLAVIVQQIYARFKAGHTRNPAFAPFGRMATYLLGRCERAMAASGL